MLNNVFNLTVVTSHKGIEKGIETSEKVNNRDFYKIVPTLLMFNNVILQKIKFSLLLTNTPIIVEFNLRIISNVLLVISRRMLGKKTILWTHGITKNMSVLSRYIRLAICYISSGVITYNQKGLEALADLGVKENKLFNSNNTIFVAGLHENKIKIKFSKRHRITYMGRLVENKEVEKLLSAFSVLTKSSDYKNYILTIIGDGERLTFLKSLAKEKDLLNSIDFRGKIIEEEKIQEILSETIFTVSPGFIGLMGIHSLSYAVPVIVSKYPKYPHSPEVDVVFDNETSVFFENEEDLVKKMKYLIDNKSICEKMGKKGQEYVSDKYSIENTVNCFERAVNAIN